MRKLGYPPLYASVYALQLVVVISIAFGRLPPQWGWPVAFAWAAASGTALWISYYTRNSIPGRLARYSPLVVLIAVVALWLMMVGNRFFFVACALGLLLGRDATLATRRALYVDLAIVLTLFYDSIGAQRGWFLATIEVVFLVAMVFVLMADYADRRLGYVRAEDKEAREALAPSMRNAALATLVVLAMAALIYLLLPQPPAAGFGIPDPDATTPIKNFAMMRGESKGGGRREDRGAGDPAPTGPGDQLAGVRPSPDGPARLDVSRGGGEPEASRSQGGEGKDEGNGRGSGERRKSARAKEDGKSGQGRGDQPISQGSPSEGQPPRGDEKSEPSSAPRPGSGWSGGKKDKNEKKSDQKKDKKEDESKPAPLVLVYLDARQALYVRTHVFAVPQGREWLEAPTDTATIHGNGRFVLEKSDDRDAVVQRYRVNSVLEPRIPAAYRPARLAFPAGSIGMRPDYALFAGGEIPPGIRYSVMSVIQQVDGRATGGFEPVPASGYTEVPQGAARVRELAAGIARGAVTPRKRAEAIEDYLRKNYAHGVFDAGAEDPAEAFLFGRRAGGGEQFASALALMLRGAGVPARIAGGYRARRLNPLHGDFEIWEADRHYWVEAYVDDRWTAFEPSPWAMLPRKEGSSSTWSTAKEYVRLAKTDDFGVEVFPPKRPSDAYLRAVLIWGWTATFGPWMLLALMVAGLVAWQQQRWLWPVLDRFDLMGLKRRRDGRERALATFQAIERIFGRRGLRRADTENHAEYIARLGSARPYLAAPLASVAAIFANARYGLALPDHSIEATTSACRQVVELIDEMSK